MKLIITLVIVTFASLMVGFNADIFVNGIDSRYRLYNVCDSFAWVMISFTVYLIAGRLATTGKAPVYQAQVKFLRTVCGIFLALSICPFINDLTGNSTVALLSNFIYGGLVLLLFLTRWIVKLRLNATTKK